MNTKKNILFISSWYPNPENPFLGNFVQRHAEATALYNNVYIINIYYSTEKKEYKGISQDGTIVEQSIATKGILGKLYYFITFIRAYKQLKYKPDIVHVNIAYPIGLLAFYLKYRYSIPYIITEHWSIYQKKNKHKRNWILNFCSRQLFKHASAVLPVSENMLQELNVFVNKPLEHAEVVYNVANTTIFKPVNKPLNNATFKLLHVSTLDEDAKNVFGLLRVIAQLKQDQVNVELNIISEIESKKHIDYAQSLGLLNHSVAFLGSKSSTEVAHTMNEHNAVVLFSNYEGLPCVIAEALCCGKPVIATNVGGIPEMINSENGILVESKNEQALYNAIIKLQKEYAHFNQEQISKEAQHKYSYQTIGKQITAIYTKIADRNAV